MISRRQFTKAFGATVTLTAITPGALWSGESTATAIPASVSPVAAELYRKAFVLDGNVLGAIRFPISDHDPVGETKLIVGSGVNVVKATLGGPEGNFEEAVDAIARAELLMERQPESFFKVQRAADFDRAKNEGKLGVIYSFELPNMLEDKTDRIELFRSLGVGVMQLTYNHRTLFGAVVSTVTRMA
jgi:membrane dipeptidase